jgi:hypothetical protein
MVIFLCYGGRPENKGQSAMQTSQTFMDFDRVVDIWHETLGGRKLKRMAFVVQKPTDGVLVNEVDVSSCYRPHVEGTRGKTVAWVYAQCPNGEKLAAKIRQDATPEAVTKLITQYIEVALQ